MILYELLEKINKNTVVRVNTGKHIITTKCDDLLKCDIPTLLYREISEINIADNIEFDSVFEIDTLKEK